MHASQFVIGNLCKAGPYCLFSMFELHISRKWRLSSYLADKMQLDQQFNKYITQDVISLPDLTRIRIAPRPRWEAETLGVLTPTDRYIERRDKWPRRSSRHNELYKPCDLRSIYDLKELNVTNIIDKLELKRGNFAIDTFLVKPLWLRWYLPIPFALSERFRNNSEQNCSGITNVPRPGNINHLIFVLKDARQYKLSLY